MAEKKQNRQIRLYEHELISGQYDGLLDRFKIEIQALKFTSTHRISEKPPKEIRVWLEWIDE